MKNNTLTIKECSDRIHKSESAVRIGLQRGGYKFGTAIQTVHRLPPQDQEVAGITTYPQWLWNTT